SARNSASVVNQAVVISGWYPSLTVFHRMVSACRLAAGGSFSTLLRSGRGTRRARPFWAASDCSSCSNVTSFQSDGASYVFFGMAVVTRSQGGWGGALIAERRAESSRTDSGGHGPSGSTLT